MRQQYCTVHMYTCQLVRVNGTDFSIRFMHAADTAAIAAVTATTAAPLQQSLAHMYMQSQLHPRPVQLASKRASQASESVSEAAVSEGGSALSQTCALYM